ncbi:hypothetical protein N7494_005400 [Penicillium frequentans]|uniref:Uncharacterized protein n=1 Tax=Penicillium frequentans TaxID=3151616 RepID=A0AAD6D0I6_9EURO|nr:hypothetical protein N7494_005400 [Penicillium glabrum]
MPPHRTKRTMQVHSSAAVPPPNIRSVPFTETNQRLPWSHKYPYSAQQGVQGVQDARKRVEMIITEISAECTKLLGTHHNTRILLRKEEEEKAKLETQMQYLVYCLQAAEQRAWRLEERVNTLEVEVASRNAERSPRDPTTVP